MDNAVYTALTRQSGLMAEMQAVANNIANASTTGYRREGVVFAEFVAALAPDDPSLSMATAQVRDTRMDQAPVTFTGGSFDLAIEGDGFFMVEGPEGPLLTRAGNFTPSPTGDMVTPDGYRLLDAGALHPDPTSLPSRCSPSDVTVVVPVRDRPDALDGLLSSLGPFRDAGAGLVVVDDGSVDGPAHERVSQRHGATYIRRERSGGPGEKSHTGRLPMPGYRGRAISELERVLSPVCSLKHMDAARPSPDGWSWLASSSRHSSQSAVSG